MEKFVQESIDNITAEDPKDGKLFLPTTFSKNLLYEHYQKDYYDNAFKDFKPLL